MAVKYYCDRCNKEMSLKEYGNYEVVAVSKNNNLFLEKTLQNSCKLCYDCYKYILKTIKEEVE